MRPYSHIAHYNLAKMLVKVGERDRAVEEAAIAARLEPLPEYRQLLDELNARSPKEGQDGGDEPSRR